MTNEYVQVRVKRDILDLFKELYELPKDTQYKNIYLYAIAASLPPKGKRLFIEDYNLDSNVFDLISEKRNKITKEDIQPQINNMDNKLDQIINDDNEKDQNTDEKLSVIIEYLKLMLFDSGFSTPVDNLESILNDEHFKSVNQEVYNLVRGGKND